MNAIPHRRSLVALTAALFCVVAAGCSDGNSAAPEPAAGPATSSAPTSSPPTETAAGLRLVALGDSETTGAGDEEGKGWVQRYADLVAEQTGSQVEVVPRASDGLTSDALLSDVQNDDRLRNEISTADIVVVGAGGADLNAGDDAWSAGSCSGTACYQPALEAYARNIADLSAAVAELRGDAPTVFRAITPPNPLTGAEDVIPPFLADSATEVGVFQARALRDATCEALHAHGGECIDVLTAFNGPDGTQDAYASGLLNHDDCCYPSGRGQQLMAEMLVETGLEPQPLS